MEGTTQGGRRERQACALLAVAMLIGSIGVGASSIELFVAEGMRQNEAHAAEVLRGLATLGDAGPAATQGRFRHAVRQGPRVRAIERGYLFDVYHASAGSTGRFAFAWPLVYAKSGRRAFALTVDGELRSSDNRVERYSGAARAPRSFDAFRPNAIAELAGPGRE